MIQEFFWFIMLLILFLLKTISYACISVSELYNFNIFIQRFKYKKRTPGGILCHIV